MSAQAGGMCMKRRPRPASLAALRQFSFRAIKHLDFVTVLFLCNARKARPFRLRGTDSTCPFLCGSPAPGSPALFPSVHNDGNPE
jgi:hypothetical protein